MNKQQNHLIRSINIVNNILTIYYASSGHKSMFKKLGDQKKIQAKLQTMALHENDVLFSNDTGILGKRNSEFSQQESNLRPSDY